MRFMTASTQGMPITIPYGLPGLLLGMEIRGCTRFRSRLLNLLRNLSAAIQDRRKCRRMANVQAH